MTQLTKHAVTNRIGVVPFVPRRAILHVGVAVLQVHVPHAITPAVEHGDWIAPPERAMPRVEAQADERRIRARHQLVDLAGRLDEGGTVVMKDGAESRRVVDVTRDPIGATCERLPPALVEAISRLDTARKPGPRGIPRSVVGEDDER